MVLVSFSGVEGIPRVKEKVQSGEKRQTIRRWKKKRPPRKGETLDLWWKSRYKKEQELLGRTPCTEVFTRKWRDIKDDFDLAKRDGFSNIADYRKHFSKQCDSGDDTKFIIIRWKKKKEETRSSG